MKPNLCYTRGLTVLDFKDKAARTTVSLRELATVLSNLGELRRAASRPGAEDSLRRSIAICEELAARKSPARADRQTLAIAQNNLAEVLVAAGRAKKPAHYSRNPSPGSIISPASSRRPWIPRTILATSTNSKRSSWPRSASFPGRQSIEAAVEHQRQAVKLTDGKVEAYRMMLAGHLGLLSKTCLKLQAYDDAIRAAIEVSKAGPASGEGFVKSARLLARCVAATNQDRQLAASRREEIGRKCSGRIAILIREAIDANPKLGETIKSDPELSGVLARPEFQSLLGSVDNVGPNRIP